MAPNASADTEASAKHSKYKGNSKGKPVPSAAVGNLRGASKGVSVDASAGSKGNTNPSGKPKLKGTRGTVTYAASGTEKEAEDDIAMAIHENNNNIQYVLGK